MEQVSVSNIDETKFDKSDSAKDADSFDEIERWHYFKAMAVIKLEEQIELTEVTKRNLY